MIQARHRITFEEPRVNLDTPMPRQVCKVFVDEKFVTVQEHNVCLAVEDILDALHVEADIEWKETDKE